MIDAKCFFRRWREKGRKGKGVEKSASHDLTNASVLLRITDRASTDLAWVMLGYRGNCSTGFTADNPNNRDLASDQMLLFALVRALEIVGEAAARVSEATRQVAADIPWGLVVSMRNRLVHAYFDVDNDVVWKTATQELPALLPKLRARVREQ